MSEDLIVRHCSPTLAGLKTANLFAAEYTSEEALRNDLRALNRVLVPKGLRALPLRRENGRALIYLYRPKRLAQDLKDAQAAALLEPIGYPCGCPERCIAALVHRLKEQSAFPHEIGLFLGYPPEDVRGYIENRALHCKCVGCWKVYGDEAAARRQFAAYKSCTANYCRRRASGASLEGLTVATRLPQ